MTPLDVFFYGIAAIGALVLAPILIPLAMAIFLGVILLLAFAAVFICEWVNDKVKKRE